MPVYKYKTSKGATKYYVKLNNKTKRGFDKRSKAIQYEAKLKLEKVEIINKVLLYDAIDDYLENGCKNITYGTLEKKKSMFNNVIKKCCENKNIFKINEIDCRNFRKCIEDMDYSSTHKNYILCGYKSIFKHSKKYFKLMNDPTYVLEPFIPTFEEKMKKKEKELKVWNVAEFEQFIKYVDDDRYKALFITLFFTGIRLGEAQALTWNDLLDDKIRINKSLTPKTTKGTYEIKEPKSICSIRDVSIGKNLYNFLIEFKKKQSEIKGFNDSWFMFGTVVPMPSTSITRKKDLAIKKSGVKRITIHEFRHSHASNLISSGLNIVAVSRRLGHENIEITLRTYTHLMNENEKTLVKYLDDSSQNLLKN